MSDAKIETMVMITGREYEALRAENEKLRAALDILQAAMTAKKPIPLALKKAIIEARAALSASQPAPAPVRTDSRFNNAERIFGDD